MKLAERLDGLPLAVATAGMYLSQTPDSFAEYLKLYEDSWNELGDNSDGLMEYGDRTLYSTWNVSLKRVEAQDPEAAQLVRFTAYLSNVDIWYEFFQRGAENGPSWLLEVVRSKPRFDRAMGKLQDYGLVEAPKKRYSMHACVHDWTLNSLNRAVDGALYGLAFDCVVKSINAQEGSQSSFMTCRRLAAHAVRLEHDRFQDLVEETGWKFKRYNDTHVIADFLRTQNQFWPAEKMYRRSLAGKEVVLGPECVSTLATVNNLGNLYGQQGKLDEAKQMYWRALSGYEQALGPEYTSTLITVNNLGILYRDQGKLDEAKEMYQRALSGYEQALGPEHTSTLNTVNNLGVLYRDQGKLDEAEEMHRRALSGYEKALGPEDTSTLCTVNNLGVLYKDQGKLGEAEQMYQRALSGYEKALGPEHTSTLHTVNNLGTICAGQGKLDEAEQMYRRALSGYEKAWGLEDNAIPILRTISNLGILYAKQGMIDEAEQMYRRALTGCTRNLGSTHLLTLHVTNSLESLRKSQQIQGG
jgi:tetratricopeptide (TPR) repeat protein